jgi:hypothetical protein
MRMDIACYTHTRMEQTDCSTYKPTHHTYILSHFSYVSMYTPLFSLIKNPEFLGYISSYLSDTFELFCHLRLWFITGKNCCILGGYALMRRIKSSRTLTMSRLKLHNSVLFCRFPLIWFVKVLMESCRQPNSISSFYFVSLYY